MADSENKDRFPASNTLFPETQETVKGIFSVWEKQMGYAIQSCIPAIFLGYKDDDRATGMGRVKPLVKLRDTGKPLDAEDAYYERGETELPIHHFQHGTFMIDAPLVEGDTGWIIAGDRDNTNVLLNNGAIQGPDSGIGKKGDEGVPLGNEGPQPPSAIDSHRYDYGFFLPDKWGGIPLPPEMKDSLVIGQVNPDATSHGRFVMDPDGTIHVLSKRWYDEKSQSLRGGAVFVDLSWKGKERADELKESWHLGEHNVTAVEKVWGDIIVNEWEDEDGGKHGGNLKVTHDAEVKGGFVAWLKSVFHGALEVFGDALFRSKVTVKHDTSRTVTIDPKKHLEQSDAQFREVMVVTGLDENRTHGTRVALKVERRRVLSDVEIPQQPVEFDVGSGGGGDVETDEKSVAWHEREGTDIDELSVKGWHDQDDVNGGGEEADPEGEGGDVSLSSIIWEGKGPGYAQYQVVARKTPGGPLVYIPIVVGADSSDSGDSGDSGDSEDKDFYIDISEETLSGDTAHPNGGVRITFQPMKDGKPYAEATVVDIWNGNDGAPGEDGDDGVGIESIVGGEAEPAGNFTKTPVIVTLTDGNTQSFDVFAKNGALPTVPFDFIHEVAYDVETHTLQKQYGHCDVTGNVTIDDFWTPITVAIPHSEAMDQ